jgi:outer membrane scaffolding protein for murein synthesis (MipA/OmpV family)
MLNPTVLRSVVLSAFALAATPLLQAQPAVDQSAPPPSGWGLGIGAGWQRPVYAGAENKTRVIPLVSFENEYVRVLGLGADLKLPSAGPVSFSLRARYALGDGYESDDAPILNGMEERKPSFWLGGAVQWRTEYAKLSAEVSGDASSHSKGTEARLGVEHDFRFGRFMFTPRVAAVWRDAKYVDYYYGVRPEEATAFRPAYEGRGTTNAEVGLRTFYGISQHDGAFLDVSATALGSSIKDSPLVDRRILPAVRLGYLYRF